MASFKAHLTSGNIVGGVGGLSLYVAGQVDAQGMLGCLTAAIIGGILPDIDADNATPLHIAFTFFAVLFSFLVVFSQGDRLSVAELLILWLLAFLFIKLVVFELFVRITVHRGVFHSVPAAVLFGFLTAIFLHRLFQLPAKISWLAGIFLGAGFILHLLLDELYSLNMFGGGGVKQSLGSALKLYSDNLKATAILYAVTIALFFATPGLDEVRNETLTAKTWDGVRARLIPEETWFGVRVSKFR